MASLNFNAFSKNTTLTNKYVYADLHLDIANPVRRDIDLDFDERAIKNSINTLFNTIPGQNLLYPDYGINLVGYLFEPISSPIAQKIGQTIYKCIRKFEPRVVVENINVETHEDEQMYTVTLSISIPALNNSLSIVGTLAKSGITLT